MINYNNMENTYNNHYLATLAQGEYTETPEDFELVSQNASPVLEYTNTATVIKKSVGGEVRYRPSKRIFLFQIEKYIYDGEIWHRSPGEDTTKVANKNTFVDATTGAVVLNTEAVEFINEAGEIVVNPLLDVTTPRLKEGYCTQFDFVAKLFGIDGQALNAYLFTLMAEDAEVTLP